VLVDFDGSPKHLLRDLSVNQFSAHSVSPW
jgi:hypothetical protein